VLIDWLPGGWGVRAVYQVRLRIQRMARHRAGAAVRFIQGANQEFAPQLTQVPVWGTVKFG
jgi:hypothetical protein